MNCLSNNFKTWLLPIIILFTLAGCSEPSSNDKSAANIASVNAGGNLNVLEGLPFTLSATVYPEGGTLSWTQTKGPMLAGLPVTGANDVELTAPDVATNTELQFVAKYVSEDGQLVEDTLVVLVEYVNSPPIAVIDTLNTNTPPYNTYEVVTLSGENSFDQDGEVIAYQWQQLNARADIPVNITSTLNQSQLTFTAPFVSQITTLTFQLMVTDNHGLSATNEIDVQIASAQSAIAANAGDDQTVDEFERVTIDASASVSSVSAVSCFWQQQSGSTATITDPNACITDFIAPDVDAFESLKFVVTVTDLNNNAASDDMLVHVRPKNLGVLHDTGITQCFDNQGLIQCGGSLFARQDADHGRDAIYPLLDKAGTGAKSFDYTKFDVNGDEIGDNDLVFNCVRDNFTGLIWEVKAIPAIPQFSSLRGAENFYSLDQSQLPLSSCPSDENCGVEVYINSINSQTYCGGANWRLPTFSELMNILDYSRLEQRTLLDPNYFPYQPDNASLGHSFYWVSDTSAEGGAKSFNWVIDIATGDDSNILNSDVAYIMLVRTP